MQRPNNCPHCGFSLLGHAIPEEHLEFYNALGAKPGDPGWVTHGRRDIGVGVRGVYDGILYWKCPECRGVWNRWPKDRAYKTLYDLAEREMKKNREGQG